MELLDCVVDVLKRGVLGDELETFIQVRLLTEHSNHKNNKTTQSETDLDFCLPNFFIPKSSHNCPIASLYSLLKFIVILGLAGLFKTFLPHIFVLFIECLPCNGGLMLKFEVFGQVGLVQMPLF